MSFYLFQGSYSSEGLKALVANPQDREAAARKMIEALGGKLHHFFFAWGSDDVVAILEMDDDKAMLAGSLLVGASGAMSGGRTTRLITMRDAMDAMKLAGKVAGSYKPATDN